MTPLKTTSLLVLAGICFIGAFLPQAHARETPYSRVCRLAGGQGWFVDTSAGDSLPLCRFGAAAIGAADLAEFQWNQVRTQAVEAFLSSTPSDSGAGVCTQAGATVVKAMDLDQKSWELCTFSDGSMVEMKTLARGHSSSANARLVEALR